MWCLSNIKNIFTSAVLTLVGAVPLAAQKNHGFRLTISGSQEQQIRFNSGKDSILLQAQRTLDYHGQWTASNSTTFKGFFQLDSINGTLMAQGGKPVNLRSQDSSSRAALLAAGGEKLFQAQVFQIERVMPAPFFSVDELTNPREIEQTLFLRLAPGQVRKGWYQVDSLVTDSLKIVRQQFVQAADSQRVVIKVWMDIRLPVAPAAPAEQASRIPFQGSANAEWTYDARTGLLQKGTTEAQLLGRQFQEEQSLLLRWRNWRLWTVSTDPVQH